MGVQARGAADRRAALTGLVRRLLPAALPLLLAIVLLAPATLGGKVMSAGDIVLFQPPFPPQPDGSRPENQLQFDSAFVFEPDGLMVREALREGRLPVWAPELAAGWPLLATQQSAPLYPLTWIGVVFPFWESQAWIAVLKLLIAGLGAYMLARALELRRRPALLAGVAFAFGTYLIVWLMHPHVNAYVLLPWLFLLGDHLCRRGAVADAAALAGVLGLSFLSGQPESGFIVAAATAAWVGHRLVSLAVARPAALRRAALGAGALVLGAALGAVMILPLVEALRESWNSSRSQPPLPLSSGLTLALPEFWGRPDRSDLPLEGPLNFTERTLYVGALPLMLALAGLVARRPRGAQLFFAGLVLAALALALDTGPVVGVVADLPVVDQIQLHRVLVLASFGLAMLAGFGLQRLLDGSAAERRRMLIAAAAVALAPVALVAVTHLSALDEARAGLDRFLGRETPVTGDNAIVQSLLRWLAPAVVALALVLVAARRPARARLVIAAALALAAIDLVAMGWGYNPAIPKAEASPPTPAAVDALRRVAGDGRVVGIGGLVPNTASRWGLLDARGHEQPVVERTNMLWFALGGGLGDGATAVRPDSERTEGLLDVFGVRAALLPPGSELPRGLRGGRPAYSGPDGVVVERPDPLPPAFVAYGWRQSGRLEDSLIHVSFGTAEQARDIPVIEGAPAPPPGSAPPATPARIVSRSDTEVVVELDAERPGQLVLLDTHYPGWRAEVDGREAEIRPANAAFRAVAVDAGRHTVRFQYRPASVIAGGAVSLAAALALAGLLLAPRLRRRLRGRAS